MDPVVLWAHAVAVSRALESRFPFLARALCDAANAAAVKSWWNGGAPSGPAPIRENLPTIPPPATDNDAADLLREIEKVAHPPVRTKARHLLRALKSGQPSKEKPTRVWSVIADDV